MKRILILLLSLGVLLAMLSPTIVYAFDNHSGRHHPEDNDVVVYRNVDHQANVKRTIHYRNNNCGLFGIDSDGMKFPIGDDDDIYARFRDDDLIIRNYDRGPRRVKITEDYKLYLDGKLTNLTDEQQKLVRDLYDTGAKMRHQTIRIGVEGAKIGVKGAKLGVKAVAAVFKALLTDYSEDEMEHDLQREADKIERDAAPLEDMADELEDTHHDFEKLYFEMCRKIPELSEKI